MAFWSKEEIELLKDLYPKYGKRIVAEKLGRSENSVGLKANRLGLTRFHYHCDEDYFEQIDSADKAYWLGFIIADGYVRRDENARSYYLGIELSEKDAGHLNLFKESIASDYEIKYRVRSLRNGAKCKMASIRLYSKKIVDDLKQYGVVPNKTNLLTSIIVPREFIWDYLRGYFDGDGSFNIMTVNGQNGNVYKYGRVSFICHQKEFIDDVQRYLSVAGIESHVYYDNGNWSLHIRRQDGVLSFYNAIYSNTNSVRLERKYNKFSMYYAA